MKNIITYILERRIQGISYNENEIIDMITDDIQRYIEENDINIEIKEVWVHGSRLRNQAKDTSDLDVVLFYSGDFNEDALFDLLHEDEFKDYIIENIPIDINPVNIKNDLDITKYKEKSHMYDIEKGGK